MALDTDQMKRRASQTLAGFSTGQKAVTIIAIVAVLASGMFFFRWASKPNYTPLFTNLEASDASAITQKLSAQKVSYQLADNGRTVMVPQANVYQLRLDMSSAGLPTGGGSGYALLDKQGITASEFRQRVDYQRALEGELAKTVSAIDGVAAATVHLVIPADDVFSDDSRKPSASVLIKTVPGKKVSAGMVQAVVNLVSSSVEGLTPDAVTVADANGTLLNAPGQNGAISGEGDVQTTQTKTFEDQLTQSVQDMLNQVMGAGHSVVRVNADLDFDQKSTTSERFDNQTPQAISEATTKETYSGNGSPSVGGVLGTNPTPLASGTSGTGNNTYSKEEVRRDNGVGKVTEKINSAPGQVKRLSVAVLLDSKSQNVQTESIKELVSAATGLSDARGDTIAVSRIAFDASTAKTAQKELAAAESANKRQTLMAIARMVATVLVVGIILLIVLKTARQRAPKALPASIPFDMAELQAARAAMTESVPEVNLLDAIPEQSMRLGLEGQERFKVDSQIGELIDRQPEEVAQLLRGWLADRRS